MRRYNFKKLATLGKRNNRLRELGSFIQDVENQLWDGHPYIFPNMRIFIEAWCDLIIDEGLHLRIKIDKDGDDRRTINENYNIMIANKELVKNLRNGEITVKGESTWSYALKIRTVESAFTEMGVDTSNWCLTNKSNRIQNNNFKDCLNRRAHKFAPISDEREKAFEQIKARFEVLKILHDGMYKGFLDVFLKEPVAPYVMPSEQDLYAITDKYIKNKRFQN